MLLILITAPPCCCPTIQAVRHARHPLWAGLRRLPGLDTPRPSKYEAPYWVQLSCLARRLQLHAVRHPLLLGLNYMAAAVMALAMGAIYGAVGRDTGGIQVRMPGLLVGVPGSGHASTVHTPAPPALALPPSCGITAPCLVPCALLSCP